MRDTVSRSVIGGLRRLFEEAEMDKLDRLTLRSGHALDIDLAEVAGLQPTPDGCTRVTLKSGAEYAVRQSREEVVMMVTAALRRRHAPGDVPGMVTR